ncbi:MAG: hypothetical protein IH841_08545 [Thaumarchaeota archaeon]|nr:hypothetical protein [Nitrososphaerota archaeon]
MLSQAFESYVFQLLQKQYSDCGVIVQLSLDSGLRPDFIMECENKLVIVDAKAKERLTKGDIDQVAGYINELDADYGIIFVTDYTEVPESVEDFATVNAIDIEYTNWSR